MWRRQQQQRQPPADGVQQRLARFQRTIRSNSICTKIARLNTATVNRSITTITTSTSLIIRTVRQRQLHRRRSVTDRTAIRNRHPSLSSATRHWLLSNRRLTPYPLRRPLRPRHRRLVCPPRHRPIITKRPTTAACTVTSSIRWIRSSNNKCTAIQMANLYHQQLLLLSCPIRWNRRRMTTATTSTTGRSRTTCIRNSTATRAHLIASRTPTLPITFRAGCKPMQVKQSFLRVFPEY